MRLEQLPIVFGVLVALLGLGLVADAWLADGTFVPVERRRRPRAKPHKLGEALVGLGVMCFGASLIGRDEWRYGTVAVLAGGALLLVGALLNARYLRELFSFRGPARRRPEGEEIPLVTTPVRTPTPPNSQKFAKPKERRKHPR